jgi:hypothetical protein
MERHKQMNAKARLNGSIDLKDVILGDKKESHHEEQKHQRKSASPRWRVGRLLFGADNADEYAAGTYEPVAGVVLPTGGSR